MRWSKFEATIEAAAWICAFLVAMVIGLAAIIWLSWTDVALAGLMGAMVVGFYWIERSGR